MVFYFLLLTFIAVNFSAVGEQVKKVVHAKDNNFSCAYTYDSESSLVTSKLVSDSTQVIHRTFYIYDHPYLMREIADDGSEEDIANLSNCTFRIFKDYLYDNGQLSAKLDKYLDLSTNQEILITRKEYGEQGELLRTIHPDGVVEQLSYCPDGTYSKKITENGKDTHFSYDPEGQLCSKTKPDGIILYYSYDDLGHLIHFHSSDGSCSYSYTYDTQDHLLEIKDLNTSLSTSLVYDKEGNVLKETFSHGASLEYEYDPSSKRTKTLLPNSTFIAYEYEGDNLKKVNYNNQFHHDYLTYDDKLSEPTIESLPFNLGTLTHTYNHDGYLQSIHSPFTAFEVLERDTTDHITKTNHNAYTYNNLHQLTSEKDNIYNYDIQNNRLSINNTFYHVNKSNQIVRAGRERFSHDLNGNPKISHKSGKRTTYAYDALDRLTSVTTDTTTYYTYDGFNRRISKTSNGKTQYFLYEGENEIGIIDPSGTITELRILGRTDKAERASAVAFQLEGKTYIPIYDLFDNVSAIIDPETHVIIESYPTTAFGVVDCNAPISPWLFASKRFDPETGLFYFGKRYYSPQLGRFLTPDPAGFIDGYNLYAYAHNDPLMDYDLYGLWSWKKIWKKTKKVIIPAAITAAAIVVTKVACIACPPLGIALAGAVKHLIPYTPPTNKIVSPITEFATGHPVPDEHSCIGQVGAPGAWNLPRDLLMNGILTSHESCRQAALAIACETQNTVNYVYNASHGFVSDILESFINILGIPTHPTILAKSFMRDCVTMGDRLRLWLHSQGCLQGETAVNSFSPNERKLFEINTFGTPSCFDIEGVSKIKHIIANGDPVTLISLLKHPINFCTNNNVTRLPAASLVFLEKNHTIEEGGAYFEALRDLARKAHAEDLENNEQTDEIRIAQ